MDPYKAAGAPPMGWTDEKSPAGQMAYNPGYPQPQSGTAPPAGWAGEGSTAGQMPPPPYEDSYQGSLQPGPGYPTHQKGYGVPPQYGGVGYGQQPQPMGHLYPAQMGAITVQPVQYVTAAPLVDPVNDYLCYSVFTMLFCCLPLGIAALIYSISAREANHIGDRMTAERASRTARTLNHVGLGLGLGFIILMVVYGIVMTAALR